MCVGESNQQTVDAQVRAGLGVSTVLVTGKGQLCLTQLHPTVGSCFCSAMQDPYLYVRSKKYL